MSQTGIRYVPSKPIKSFLLALIVLSATSVVFPQTRRGSTDIPGLMERLKNEPIFPLVVNQLADANAIQAVPLLKEKFAQIEAEPSHRPSLDDELVGKGAIASALVRLGEKQGAHWEFLVAQATKAVESDAPWPMFRDSDGKYIAKQLAPAFLVWAKDHNADPFPEARNQEAMQLRLRPLAMTGDPRGRQLLKKALTSPNYLVQSMGAQGLALLKDKESIPQIIDACLRTSKTMSPEAALVVAWALPFFDDARAQKAAEKFILDRAILESLKEKNRTHGPRGLFR